MGTNECSQSASKSSWDSQDFGDVNMVLKLVHFDKSSRPQWVNGGACTNLPWFSEIDLPGGGEVTDGIYGYLPIFSEIDLPGGGEVTDGINGSF